MNRACEKLLGYRQEEALGKSMQEQIAPDTMQVTTMGSSLLRAREWSGSLVLKKKSQETVTTSCKAVPFASTGR